MFYENSSNKFQRSSGHFSPNSNPTNQLRPNKETYMFPSLEKRSQRGKSKKITVQKNVRSLTIPKRTSIPSRDGTQKSRSPNYTPNQRKRVSNLRNCQIDKTNRESKLRNLPLNQRQHLSGCINSSIRNPSGYSKRVNSHHGTRKLYFEGTDFLPGRGILQMARKAPGNSRNIGHINSSSQSSSLVTNKSTASKVLCEVCFQYRNSNKYKLHLKCHIKEGKITAKEMAQIIFQTRYSRQDAFNKHHSVKFGYSCTILNCNSIVIDLHSHLFRVHRLEKEDELYLSAMENCEAFERRVFYKRGGIKCNPMIEHSNMKEESISCCLSADDDDNDDDSTEDNQSVFDFPSDECDDDIGNFGNVTLSSIHNTSHKLSEDISNSLNSYCKHSSTILGGSHSSAFIQMDNRNLQYFLKIMGEDSLFCMSKINEHISHELDIGKSPSTLSSRLLSYSRYVQYLKTYRFNLFPEDQFDLLSSEIKGMITSLNKLNKRRQLSIMSKSRHGYSQSTKVLKDWRRKRSLCNYSCTFEKYLNNQEFQIDIDDYKLMRDYLITELVIPNGLRPGVISGMSIEEIVSAKNDITEDGFHKAMVANHKTGHIQTATLFIYKEIFEVLDIFVHRILKRLPVYKSCTKELDDQSLVFQSFSGNSIPSSRITPILRNFLSQMGISFSGTLTDLRKAAATLTGKFDPKLNDLMAIFLCHSRKAHDQYYCMNLGHPGLVNAFKQLENFQADPEQVSSCNASSSQNLQSNNQLIINPPIPSHHTLENLTINDSSNSLDGRGIYSSKDDSLTSSTPLCSPSRSTVNQPSSPDSSVDFPLYSRMESREHFASNSSVDNLPSPISSRKTDQVFFSITSTSSATYHDNSSLLQQKSNLNASVLGRIEHHDLLYKPIEKPDSVNKDNNLKMMSLQISVQKCKVTSKGDSNICLTTKKLRSRPKCMSNLLQDEHIFEEVFLEYINRVASNLPVSGIEILESAHNSPEFSQILSNLYERYSEKNAHKTIINRVRSLGSHRRQSTSNSNQLDASSEELLLNFSLGTQTYIRTKCHYKSIFSLKKDEILFRVIFSDLIDRISKRQFVSKVQIIERTKDTRFTPVMNRLNDMYSDCSYKKIVNKVRTMGISKRAK